MRPDESMRVKCVELAIAAGDWKDLDCSLVSAALAIEKYVTGKTAIELAKLAQPPLLTGAQEAAVRIIVSEMLAAMFEGTDGRIRDAIKEADKRWELSLDDLIGRMSSAAVSVRVDADGSLRGAGFSRSRVDTPAEAQVGDQSQ